MTEILYYRQIYIRWWYVYLAMCTLYWSFVKQYECFVNVMFYIDIPFPWDVVVPFLKQMHYVVSEKRSSISYHVLPRTVWWE